MSRNGRRTGAEVPIVVFKTKRGRCAALGVLRTLGRLGHEIYLVYSDPRDPVSRSHYVRERLWCDRLSRPDDAGIEWLRNVGMRIGRRPILIPTDDVATIAVSDFSDGLMKSFRFPLQPKGLARSLSNKRRLHELAQRLGVPVPRAVFPRSIEEVETFLEHSRFPVVVKSSDPVLLADRSAARSVSILGSRRETIDYYRMAESQEAPNLMIQEYVPGPPETVWMFNGYFDERSECLFGATGRKIHQFRPYTGPTTLGEIVPNPIVADTAVRLARDLGYRGIIDIGFRFDVRDGRYKLLDVNARIGATFRLFAGTNGMDVARAMTLDLTGRPVPSSVVNTGRKWLAETTELPAALTYYRDGLIGPTTWVRSMRGIEEVAWFARDDPFPAIVAYRDAVRPSMRRRAGEAPPDGLSNEHAPDVGPVDTEAADGPTSQATVDAFFDEAAGYWDDLYEQETTYGEIHRHRLRLALAWLEPFLGTAGDRALDVGCGAGHLAVALATRGLQVSAVDRAAAMVERTARNSASAGVGEAVRPSVGDAVDLRFPDETFALVVALGVLPWLREPEEALVEMARVLRPGGALIVNVDNRLRMDRLIDPVMNPAFAPLKGPAKRLAEALGVRRFPEGLRPSPRVGSASAFDRALARTGIEKLTGITFGFGPYTFMGRRLLSEAASLRVHRWMQHRADAGMPVIRSIGSQYMVLGRKPDQRSADRDGRA